MWEKHERKKKKERKKTHIIDMKRNEEQQLQIEAKDLRLWLLHRKNMRVAFRIVGASLAGTVIAPDSAPRSMTIFIMNHCTPNMIRGNMTSSAAGHNLLFLRSSRSPLLHMSQEFPCSLQPGQDFPSCYPQPREWH